MKPYKICVSVLVIIVCAFKSYCQSIAISDVPYTPLPSAMLDVYSTTRGMLPPSLTLAQRNAIIIPATGLLIYQTTAPAGYYYYNGSIWTQWTLYSPAWVQGGNTLLSNQYIGTLSNHDLPFITNNTEKMRLNTQGELGIGSAAFNPASPELLLVDYGSTTSNTMANFKGSRNGTLKFKIQNTKNTGSASCDIVATADNGTDTSNYIDMGINSSNYNSGVEYFGSLDDGYLYTYAAHLLIGTQSTNTDIVFLVSGGQMDINQAMRIDGATKNIIVGRMDGTATPAGNTIRGPNAAGPKRDGVDLTISAGKGAGTGTGGNLNLTGGGTVSGTGGIVKINVSTNYKANINTGTNNQNITIGNASNNIILPKWTTVGGLNYNSNSSGQLANASLLAWDNTNSRMGIGSGSPTVALHSVTATATGATQSDLAIIEEINALSTSTSLIPAFNLLRQFPTAQYAGGSNQQSGILNFAHRNAGSAFLDVAQVKASTLDANSLLYFSTRTGMANGNPSGGVLATNMWVTGNMVHVENLNGGATTLSCDANGNIIRTPSDAKLKRNVVTINNALDKVMAMRGVNYKWLNKDKYGRERQIGFIAQELEQVVPEAVSNGGEYKSVNYQLLTAVLTEAIKEQQKIIDDLESQLEEPENALDKLEEKLRSNRQSIASVKNK